MTAGDMKSIQVKNVCENKKERREKTNKMTDITNEKSRLIYT